MGHLREEAALRVSRGDGGVCGLLHPFIHFILPQHQRGEQTIDHHSAGDQRDQDKKAGKESRGIDLIKADRFIHGETGLRVALGGDDAQRSVIIPHEDGAAPVRLHLTVIEFRHIGSAVLGHLITAVRMIEDHALRVGQKSVACIGVAAAQDVDQLIQVEINAEVSEKRACRGIIDALGKRDAV